MFWRSAGVRYFLFVLGMMGAGVFPGASHAATTFHVESTADAPDANPGDGVCASAAKKCTLRAAIDEANADGGAARIELRPGRYEVDTPLRPTAPISLQGAQPRSTAIAASASFSGDRVVIFDAAASDAWREVSDLTIDGSGRAGGVVTLGGVKLRITRVVIRGGVNDQGGGAGVAASGPLALLQSSLFDNRVGQGGGRGAALLVENAPAWLTQSTITGNRGRNSGGVFARNAAVTIDYSSLVGNAGNPVGGYQQNPKSTLRIQGSWLGETQAVSGRRRIDCRSTTLPSEAIASSGDNLIAVTGPTGEKLSDGKWLETYEFFCGLGGANDRMGSLVAPLEGPWRVVTGPTGLIGVEAGVSHPASRMVRPDRCPAADAWGRPIPQGENCDAGALYASVWTSTTEPAPTLSEVVTKPASDPENKPPEGNSPAIWIWVAGFGIAAIIAALVMRARTPRRPSKK